MRSLQPRRSSFSVTTDADCLAVLGHGVRAGRYARTEHGMLGEYDG